MSKHDETLSQHRRLRLIADRLRLLVAAPPQALPEARVRSVFVAEVASFADTLLAHFAHEEEGGYMSAVIVERPDLHETIVTLQGEHEQLSRGLSDLMTALAGNALAGAMADLHAVLKQFEAHEHQENELIQSTLNTDLGAGD